MDRAIFEVNDKVAFQDEEEFVFPLMLVPVVFPLQNSHAHHGLIYLTERLVVPRVGVCFEQSGNIYQAKSTELDVQMRVVRITFWIAHARYVNAGTGAGQERRIKKTRL